MKNILKVISWFTVIAFMVSTVSVLYLAFGLVWFLVMCAFAAVGYFCVDLIVIEED